jgi:hypothetical protein
MISGRHLANTISCFIGNFINTVTVKKIGDAKNKIASGSFLLPQFLKIS